MNPHGGLESFFFHEKKLLRSMCGEVYLPRRATVEEIEVGHRPSRSPASNVRQRCRRRLQRSAGKCPQYHGCKTRGKAEPARRKSQDERAFGAIRKSRRRSWIQGSDWQPGNGTLDWASPRGRPEGAPSKEGKDLQVPVTQHKNGTV